MSTGVDSDGGDADEAGPGKTGQSSGAAALRPPPYSEVAEHFSELEGVAETCGMPDVSYHLRKAKLTWMNNHGSRETKQTWYIGYFTEMKRRQGRVILGEHRWGGRRIA